MGGPSAGDVFGRAREIADDRSVIRFKKPCVWMGQSLICETYFAAFSANDGLVAQLVEQCPFKALVQGSSPCQPTTFSQSLWLTSNCISPDRSKSAKRHSAH